MQECTAGVDFMSWQGLSSYTRYRKAPTSGVACRTHYGGGSNMLENGELAAVPSRTTCAILIRRLLRVRLCSEQFGVDAISR
eukprot:607466-Pyramimonas_sp.AAC.2